MHCRSDCGAFPNSSVSRAPLTAGWSDVGAWDAVWDMSDKDGDDLRWAGQHLAPWIKRQLVGGMVGATVTAKRPALAPIGTGPAA